MSPRFSLIKPTAIRFPCYLGREFSFITQVYSYPNIEQIISLRINLERKTGRLRKAAMKV